MNYEIGFDTQQGVLLVHFSGILTENALFSYYLDATDLLERYRMRCSIMNLLHVTASPLSSNALTRLSRHEPRCISTKPRVFVASGRHSIELWRSFISNNRNPTRTRLAGTISEALELLDLRSLVLDVRLRDTAPKVPVGVLAQSEAGYLPRVMQS